MNLAQNRRFSSFYDEFYPTLDTDYRNHVLGAIHNFGMFWQNKGQKP